MTAAQGQAVAAAAMRLLGAPFRLHGRDPVYGLDCVGLVGAALESCGKPIALPIGYRLKQLDAGPFVANVRGAGIHEVSGPIEPGDIVLVRPGPAQHHVLIAGFNGQFIHAHAGLGRVTLTPAPLPWPILRQWRTIT